MTDHPRTSPLRITLLASAGLGLLAVAIGVLVLVLRPELVIPEPADPFEQLERRLAAKPGSADIEVTPADDRHFTENWFDDSGYFAAMRFDGPIDDPSDLAQLSVAVDGRAARGIEAIRGQLDRLPEDGSTGVRIQRARFHREIGALKMYDGDFEEAARSFSRARDAAPASARGFRTNLEALMGVAALRRGELDNCVSCCNESSCIFPLDPEAMHRFPDGSETAIRHFLAYLDERPDDLGVRWLLNVAAMTLGRYPEVVPDRFLLSVEPFDSEAEVGRFANVAAAAGLNDRGPNMAGGCIVDDFDGDGHPDVFFSSYDANRGASLFVNQGDGTFEDRSGQAGLDHQIAALNAVETDFNNDGLPDVLMLRGGWEEPLRMSLLLNEGGTFADVTLNAGLADPIASQAAAWADFDTDGLLDVYVAGEYRGEGDDPRRLGRLYRNLGDGTFEEVGGASGVRNARLAKGCAWGDYDDDGDPDLYVSNLGQPNCLYRNNGDGTFTDEAPRLGLDQPRAGFACWWFDFNNDGHLDLYVNAYASTLADVVLGHLDLPGGGGEPPALYRNLGDGTFADVTAEVGLDRPTMPMGSNFGDIDNDGFLDLYLGTGMPSYTFLTPNVLLRNHKGHRFQDVTTSAGVGHLQKGHGVAFADLDGDGDQELIVEAGGATPGDRAHNLLFENPGNGNRWLRLRLVGTTSNRVAAGARVRVDVRNRDGSKRSIHRLVGATSSFGGNGYPLTIGLGTAGVIDAVSVRWPGGGPEQVVRGLPLDGTAVITQGRADPGFEIDLRR